MMRKEKKQKQEFCQSRFYKDWNPDIMADYNRWQKKSGFQNKNQNNAFTVSMTDKHLKYFFKQPQKQMQLIKTQQVAACVFFEDL